MTLLISNGNASSTDIIQGMGVDACEAAVYAICTDLAIEFGQGQGRGWVFFRLIVDSYHAVTRSDDWQRVWMNFMLNAGSAFVAEQIGQIFIAGWEQARIQSAGATNLALARVVRDVAQSTQTFGGMSAMEATDAALANVRPQRPWVVITSNWPNPPDSDSMGSFVYNVVVEVPYNAARWLLGY